jgi:hypothetical protein
MTDSPVARSQPELAIYDRDTHAGTSAGGYPDFIQGADGVIRPPSRFLPPETVSGGQERFTMDIPDRTYFWGPGMNLGVGIARAGDPDHGLPERRAGELYGEIARGGLSSASHIPHE